MKVIILLFCLLLAVPVYGEDYSDEVVILAPQMMDEGTLYYVEDGAWKPLEVPSGSYHFSHIGNIILGEFTIQDWYYGDTCLEIEYRGDIYQIGECEEADDDRP